MNRTGIVIERLKDKAVVELLKHTACGDCGACHLGDENKHITITCDNKLGANIGEKVEVELSFSEVLSAAFIMYTIPLFALLVGVFGGYFGYSYFVSPQGSEVMATLVGFVLMAISYLLINKQDQNFSKDSKYLSKIVQIHNRTQILTPQQMAGRTSNFGHKKLSL